MLFWIAIGTGALFGLVGLMALVGLCLPKSHVASRSILLESRPDTIWAALTDYARQPTWRSDLRAVERSGGDDSQPIWVEISQSGEKLPLQTLSQNPSKQLVRKIANPRLPFGGTWTYDLKPTERGTELVITEHGEIYNPIFRFLSKFFNLAATIEHFQADLKAHLTSHANDPAESTSRDSQG